MKHTRHLLSTEHLSAQDVLALFRRAQFYLSRLQTHQEFPSLLSGKVILFAFFERSTRTRLSFELAAKKLGATVLQFHTESSSLGKGETFLDTFRTLNAMYIDAIVLRHALSGGAAFLAQTVDTIVINAGDGAHQHPTQALLDAFTLWDQLPQLAGKRLCYVGDITHSRVVRSGIALYRTLNAEVAVCGPPTLIPPMIAEAFNIPVFYRLEEALQWADIVNPLRIQQERIAEGLIPDLKAYFKRYGIQLHHLEQHPDVLILHPGPVNWGIELAPEIQQIPQNLILSQVTHGVAIRAALLEWLLSQ